MPRLERETGLEALRGNSPIAGMLPRYGGCVPEGQSLLVLCGKPALCGKARNGQLAAAAGADAGAAAAGTGVAGADETVLPLASRESVR